MKKIGFEQQGNSTYLVYELGPEDNVDSMSLGMLMNNRIPGFAPAMLTQIDDKKLIKYNVTARIPASQYLLGTVNKKRILGVFGGVVRAILSAEDYMIDNRTIQLDLGSIFSDVATADTVLLCLPVVAAETEPMPDLCAFFKNLLFNAQYDERENRDYVAKLMSYLNGAPAFSLSEFKRMLDYLMAESVPSEIRPQPVPAAGTGVWSAAAQPISPAAPIKTERTYQLPVQQRPVHTHSDPAPTTVPQDQSAKQISLFYLLQHYNKDNAAAYKAQKETKKTGKKTKRKDEFKCQKQQGTTDFSVPGQAEIPAVPADEYPMPQGEQQPVLPQHSVSQAASTYSTPQAIQRPVPPSQLMSQATQAYSAPHPVQQTAPPQQPIPQVAPAYSIPHPTQYPAQGAPVISVTEETIYFSENESDETVLLGHESQVQKLMPYFVRKRNNERIPINKVIFRLGRDADYNDYAVTDNRYIGHGHCHIVIRDGEYFVVDDNSKNHTKVNGEVITPGVEIKIAHGYTICLADEDFEFKLY